MASRVFFRVFALIWLGLGMNGSMRAQLGNPFSNGPSFGVLMARKTVVLQSKLPPIFKAAGKTVVVSAKDSLLSIAIEKQLTQNDSTIRVGGSNPDLLIECSVSQSSPVRGVVVNDSNGSSTQLQGSLSVIFRMTEPRSRKVVKSDIASSSVDDTVSRTSKATSATKVFGLKVPASGPSTSSAKPRFSSTAEAQNFLVQDVARKIASYIVNTEQPVMVPLAVGGALNNANKLADSGLWSRYLEALETLTPFTDTKADAYRLYDIGVANEALAYGAEENKSAIKYLEQASNDYGKALDAKPEEKGFIESQGRIKAALEHYSDIGKTTPMTAASASPLTTSVGAPSAPPPGALTNKDVIDMVAGKLDEANIIDTIQNSPDVAFDLSPKGQLALTKGGVPGRILMSMKQRERGTAPARR